MRVRDGVVVAVLVVSLQACTKRAFLAGAAGAAAVPTGFVLLFAGASGGDAGPPSSGKSVASGVGAVLFVGGLITVPVSMIVGLAGYASEHPALRPSPADARATPRQMPAARMQGPMTATPAASMQTPGTLTPTTETNAQAPATQTPATNTQTPATNTQAPATNTQAPSAPVVTPLP